MPAWLAGMFKEGGWALAAAKAIEYPDFALGFATCALLVAFLLWWRSPRRVQRANLPGTAIIDHPPVHPSTRHSPFDDEAVEKLGIVTCVATLQGTHFTPEECRRHTESDLRFSGLQGTKWVDSDEAKQEFREFLRRLRPRPRKSVRFLLVNPFGHSMPQILEARKEIQDQERDLKHLREYVDLMNEFDFLEVRLFDHFPYFRIVIIDGTQMAVSRYKVWSEYRYGSRAPHLILRNDSNPEDGHAVSLFFAFDQHFEHVWQDQSRSVADVLAYYSLIRK